MSEDPFAVVRQFEEGLCEYTGAPYAVTTTSCTMALLLAVAWHLRTRVAVANGITSYARPAHEGRYGPERPRIEIPKRTYVSVPMSIIHAGGRPTFRDEQWKGAYQLKPLKVWDSARWFSAGMYKQVAYELMALRPTDAMMTVVTGGMVCVSFHWGKTLGIEQGGAILHDSAEADEWLRQARFDGRIEGMSPAAQAAGPGFKVLGHHAYMSPETAAAGLVRLRLLPRHNEPLPNDDYPPLDEMDIFK